jgi:23S rRNA (cytosine1962-C5)-methyltransferase
MDRARVWPDFREAWIVHEDADLLVIDKPAGVSSQAADPGRPDDIVTRLKRFLAARASDPYLGVHQRLDRDTSGLLVFARRRAANQGLAAQFESRQVEKGYVACVSGWPRGREQATLRDSLAPGPDGTMRVVSARAHGAKDAVTRVRVLARHADRALLELDLDTGRTHQARVQLAHVRTPIAGDVLYGGPRAQRLMLHANAIALRHPLNGDRVRFGAPIPRDFESWVSGDDSEGRVYDAGGALEGALERAIERRWGLGRSEGQDWATTAFRLVNEEGDGLPRLAVDVYGGWLVAQLYGDDGPWAEVARKERLLDALHGLGFDGVYLKVRPKQANVIDTRREDVAPRMPLRGMAAPDEFVVLEEGAPLLVRLGDGLSTGIFLDQRANRRRLREMARGKTVANLFAYTCLFTMMASLGGAKKTVSVDVSAAALERGRANLANAGALERGEHVFVAADVFAWLARASRRGEVFDIVVLDPPSYSTTRRGRFVADTDYVDLASSALSLVAPGGRLLACTSHRGISPARFRRILFDACRAAKREPMQIKDFAEGSDFPVAPGGDPHMKSALVLLA